MRHRRSRVKRRKSWIEIVDIVVLVLNCVAVLILLLSYLAPSTSPRESTLIAIIGFGYYFLVAGNLICIIYWLIRRKYPFSLISAIALVCGFTIFTRFIGLRVSTEVSKKKDSGNVRILNYNVREFVGVGIYEKEFTKPQIFDVINVYKPDIVTMQEFSTPDSVYINDFKSKLGYNYSFAASYKQKRNSPIENIISFDVIVSRYPIIKAGAVPAPKMLGLQAIYADVKIKDQVVRVYCVHLASINIVGGEKSRYLSGNGALENSSFIIGKSSYAFLQRAFQVERIKRHMENCNYPMILAGDFNDTPISYAVNELGDRLKNASFEKGGGFVTTYNNKFPLQIDYIMTSNNFDIISYEAPKVVISDHRPVVADVKLNF